MRKTTVPAFIDELAAQGAAEGEASAAVAKQGNGTEQPMCKHTCTAKAHVLRVLTTS